MKKTLKDSFGNELSSYSADVVEAVDHFADQLLRLGPEVEQILEKADHYSDHFLLQVYAAFLFLYGQTKETLQKSLEYLRRAEQLIRKANSREKSFFQGIRLWAGGSLAQALLHLEAHCREWSEDLVALKAAEFLYYCHGQQFEGQRFLKLTMDLYKQWKDHPLFLSIHSFALELTGDYDLAEREAVQALNEDAANPWAHHTLSHVYINRGEIDSGIQKLESFVPVWQKSGRLIESHNLWHLALLYLENLDFIGCQHVYDRAEWRSKIETVGEEVDAASLLWRLDMEGIEVSHLWKELAAGVDGHALFGTIPFVNVQLCYALKRGGDEALLQEALASLDHCIENRRAEDAKVWKEVGYPLIRGSLAFADCDYKQAVQHMTPIMERVGCVGGSDAQVDLFRQTYLKSLIRAEKLREAKAWLEQMTHGRDLTLLEKKWQSEIALFSGKNSQTRERHE